MLVDCAARSWGGPSISRGHTRSHYRCAAIIYKQKDLHIYNKQRMDGPLRRSNARYALHLLVRWLLGWAHAPAVPPALLVRVGADSAKGAPKVELAQQAAQHKHDAA